MYPQGCGGSSPFFGTMMLQDCAAPGDFSVMSASLDHASAARSGLSAFLPIGLLILFLFLFSTPSFAQDAIPAGTVLPAQLGSSLNSQKSHPGRVISARLMQDVPLPARKKIPAGARLSGRVISVQPANGRQSAQIVLRFDALHYSRHSIPITTNLRALASLMEVEDAQVPKTGPDRGTPSTWISRNLIGGEVAYGDGGPVTRGSQVVGQALIDGILAPTDASPASGCRGEVAGNSLPQALWVFSSDACGVYGLDNVQIRHAGRTSPVGEIILASKEGKLVVGRGGGLLLRVSATNP